MYLDFQRNAERRWIQVMLRVIYLYISQIYTYLYGTRVVTTLMCLLIRCFNDVPYDLV